MDILVIWFYMLERSLTRLKRIEIIPSYSWKISVFARSNTFLNNLCISRRISQRTLESISKALMIKIKHKIYDFFFNDSGALRDVCSSQCLHYNLSAELGMVDVPTVLLLRGLRQRLMTLKSAWATDSKTMSQKKKMQEAKGRLWGLKSQIWSSS